MAGWREEGYQRFGEGIDRTYAVDNPDFPDGAMWDATNIVYDGPADNPEAMGGYQQLGATIGGTPIITGLFDYAEGTQLVAAGDDGKIYKRTTGDFAQVTDGTGLDTTDTTRVAGTMFYGDTTSADILVLANGVDAVKKYNGTALSALGGSPPSASQFPTAFMGKLFLAKGDTIYYSVTSDCEDWTGTGSGNIQIYRGYGGDITGLYAFAGNLFIFKRTKIFRMAMAATINEVSIEIVSPNIGTVSHHSIQEAGPEGGGYIMFMSDSGIESLIPTDRAGSFVTRDASQPISELVRKRNMAVADNTFAVYNNERKEYYSWSPSTGKTVPAWCYIANTARRRKPIRWTRADLKDMTAGTMYKLSGEYVQIVANNAGQVFQLHVGDNRSNAGYRKYIYTRAYTQGRPNWVKQYGWVYVSALAKGAYDITVRPVLGRVGMNSVTLGTSDSINNPGQEGWGTGKYGQAFWGGAATTGVRIRPQAAARGNYVRMQIITNGANEWFRLNGIQIASALGSDGPREK